MDYKRTDCRKGIIVHLDRRFVIYPGVDSVDEGAGVDDVEHEVPLLHRPLLHRYHSMRGSQPVYKFFLVRMTGKSVLGISLPLNKLGLFKIIHILGNSTQGGSFNDY